MKALRQNSIIGTIISLVGLFLTASGLFRQLRLSFRAIWKHEPPLVSGTISIVIRTIIRERLISVVMVMGGAGLLMAVVAQISAIQWVGRLLGGASLFNKAFGWTVGVVSSFLFDVLTFALLFKFLPPVPIRTRDVWPASVLCALVWVLAGEFLTLYGAFIGDSRSAYGAIGGLFAAIIWMKIVSQALFFGAELCKVSVMQAGGYPKLIGIGPASSSSGSDKSEHSE